MIEALWSARNDMDRDALRRALSDSDLEGALFAIEAAVAGVSADTIAQTRATLDGLGEATRNLRRDTSVTHRGTLGSSGDDARALIKVLGDAGVEGDQATYHDVASSLLSEVVARRRGMPILLSAVWILVGSRAGLLVEGIGLPGHFVVRVGGEEGLICDPFRRGAPLSTDECRALVRRLANHPLDDRHLRAATFDAMASRVLRNVMGSLEREGESIARYRASVLLAELSPQDPQACLLRAQLAETNRARDEALSAWADLASRFPGEPSLQAAASEGRARVRAWPRGN